MYKIQSVVDHIVETYGFEVSPCLIPRSDFQYLKRDFYIFILRHVSEKLFYFLRDKISPIKYLDERYDNSIWLIKRGIDGRVLYEVEIIPDGTLKRTKEGNSADTYKIRILGNHEDIVSPPEAEFDYPFKSYVDIDKYFIKINHFKQILREKRLSKIL